MTYRNKWKYAGEGSKEIVDTEGFIVADVYDIRDVNLIRLAPELLEALEKSIDLIQKTYGPKSPMVKPYRELIAKAQGKRQ